MDRKGVALIVVHGVADQKPGETARALVELMVAASPAGDGPHPVYRATTREDFVLEVDPLLPRNAPPRRTEATPRGEDRSWLKDWLQSIRSDFRRPGWEAPHDLAGLRSQPHRAGLVGGTDRGIAASDYLLAKHFANGADHEAFETSAIGVERTVAGRSTPITVYEMYWADLSRLSGALPRLVTELFTMVFRLSKLGRDTVDEALVSRRATKGRSAVTEAAWRLTNTLQTGLDWLFAHVLALLFAQLSLLALVFIALGVAASVDSRVLVHVGLAGAVAVVALLIVGYRHRDAGSRPGLWFPLAVAVACTCALLLPILRPWVSGLLLFGAVTFVYELGLRIADDRFPFVRRAGRVLWLLLAAAMAASAVAEVARFGPQFDAETFDVGWHAGLFGLELTLQAVKIWWMGAGVLLVVWLVAGAFAWRETGYESRASLATGRLGLTLSLAAFLTVTMAIWALVTTAADIASRNVVYVPCVFAFDESEVQRQIDLRRPKEAGDAKQAAPVPPAYPPLANRCLFETEAARKNAVGTRLPTAQSGRLFLTDRYQQSTESFALLAFILLALIAFLVAMFMPSVLAEMKLLAARGRDRAHKHVAKRRHDRGDEPAAKDAGEGADRSARVHRLGRWLTAGYRKLDGVVWLVTTVGVLLGLLVAIVFYMGGNAPEWVRWADGLTLEGSQSLLKPLVLTAASVVAALTLLGGVLSRYLPALRGPLDIALDVDNHFREFPRAAIPRARIFSRYAALLRHVVAQGHDRIVIVAHSQGTVISAELLRFLAAGTNGRPPGAGSRPRLDGVALPEVSLLTLGCPLRQLYAARFPLLYRWVIERRGRITGPKAHDVGAARWINAFCSGDYVGRWLWSDSPDDGDPVGHPMVDTVDKGPFGRAWAYDGFEPMPPLVAPFHSRNELEVCLGFGAHTHYFETDQSTVAFLIDALVAWPRNIETP